MCSSENCCCSYKYLRPMLQLIQGFFRPVQKKCDSRLHIVLNKNNYLEKCKNLHVNLFGQCFRERPKSGTAMQAAAQILVALNRACLTLIDGLLCINFFSHFFCKCHEMAINWACVLITRCGSSCPDHLPILRAKTCLALNHKKHLPCLVLPKAKLN